MARVSELPSSLLSIGARLLASVLIRKLVAIAISWRSIALVDLASRFDASGATGDFARPVHLNLCRYRDEQKRQAAISVSTNYTSYLRRTTIGRMEKPSACPFPAKRRFLRTLVGGSGRAGRALISILPSASGFSAGFALNSNERRLCCASYSPARSSSFFSLHILSFLLLALLLPFAFHFLIFFFFASLSLLSLPLSLRSLFSLSPSPLLLLLPSSSPSLPFSSLFTYSPLTLTFSSFSLPSPLFSFLFSSPSPFSPLPSLSFLPFSPFSPLPPPPPPPPGRADDGDLRPAVRPARRRQPDRGHRLPRRERSTPRSVSR